MRESSLSSRNIFAGAGATLLVLLVSIFLSFQRFNELKTANYWNIHTYQVLLETGHVIRGLVNIQTGARGFLQTGDETFLDPYKAGRAEYASHYKEALRLTSDRPIQQKRLQLLKRQHDLWMNGHVLPLIEMRRRAPDTATALRLAEPGVRKRKIIMDAMRKTVASIEQTELELLAQRTKSENQAQALTQTTLLVNGIFAFVLATGLSLFLARGARTLERRNKELSEQMARRERAEREAGVLHEHNQMILKAARDGITGVNQAGKISFFNPAAE
ncbi:MAG TPA: CHASE3 domain-containing protein, partial [Abditibacteriaceae bacterium]